MSKESFVIRVESSRGMFRAEFPSNQATFGELQQKIQDKFGIAPDLQVLSLTRPSQPQFVKSNSKDTLAKIGLQHGQVLYLILATNQSEAVSTKQKEEKEAETDKDKPKAKSVTLKTSEWVNDPKHRVEDTGPKHVPFHEWIEDRQKKYANQPWNIDPPTFDYKPIKFENHVEFSKLPPNAVIKRQEYRHCDVIRFMDDKPIHKFKSEWEKSAEIQRAAYLIGRYELEENALDEKRKGKKLLYANVYALYIPPQKGEVYGVKLLKDPHEGLVDKVIAACGMERVGWTITTLDRSGKKYHGDIFMSGQEIFTAARLQEKYKNPNTGYSRFITLITRYGQKEAQGFQISDQGVAMIRQGLISPDEDRGFMKVNAAPPKVYLPAVINENKQIPQGETFLPDALLVNVLATLAKTIKPMFQHIHFPPNGTLEHLSKHLAYHKDKPKHLAFSDFSLLVFLPQVMDLELVCEVAQTVSKKEKLKPELEKRLDDALQRCLP
ncbi:hypothetical protein RFI_10444 [Reticulomyxa filosa]|uniref:Nuclear pore localisation protein NPL4 C-terminal domain-containing protein n=1 Tax=Reticulomyxa filosa TaxID=46433 RepID=X6NLA3_RETFI|nr:hypothetical protein RFI_10444 [Reticulomyxa filosa]|eukprot:ETO26693.1 hypothetical protein RFI_10444 [Reticulomyxa filosa]